MATATLMRALGRGRRAQSQDQEPAQTSVKKGPSARHRVVLIVKRLQDEHLERDGFVRLPDLTVETQHELNRDPDLLNAFVAESLHTIVYETAQSVAANTRNVILGDEVVNAAQVKTRANKLQRKWLMRLEHVGDRHIRLGDMTAPELIAAASERRSRALTEVRIARLQELLAVQLSEGQKVSDRFRENEIEKLFETVKEEIPSED